MLKEFQLVNAALACVLGDPLEPRIDRVRINPDVWPLHVPDGEPVLLWAGLGVVIDGERIAYSGPIPQADLDALETEIARYFKSFT